MLPGEKSNWIRGVVLRTVPAFGRVRASMLAAISISED